VRSQQTIESTNAASTSPPSGVPGATTNQPPAQSSAPINGAAQGLAGNGQAGAAGGGKRESIINYEVDKTIRVVKGATGLIKRINAAVVVNNSVTVNEKGKTTSTPLTDIQIEKMTALVRETVGFNKDRGDSVNLLNAAFAPEKIEVVDVPLWRQPEVIDILRSFAWPVGTLLFGALVLMGVLRPALKALAQPPVASNVRVNQLDAMESEMPERPKLTAPSVDPVQVTTGQTQLEDARKLTRDNPAAVANIIKTWMNGEAPA
jgi:flagellar M-ring protein FliF